MARRERLYQGAIIVNGAPPTAGGELWAVGSTVVAFAPDPITGRTTPQAVIRTGAVVTMTDDRRLHVEGEGDDGPVVIEAAQSPGPGGSWAGYNVHQGETMIATAATITWSTQDVRVTWGGGTLSYPGAKTSVVGGQRWIEPWDGNPEMRFAVSPVAGGCRSCGGK